jgi:uncharacterized protein YoxC
MKALSVPGVAALGPAGPDITDLWRMVRELTEAVDELKAKQREVAATVTEARAENELLRAQVQSLSRDLAVSLACDWSRL